MSEATSEIQPRPRRLITFPQVGAKYGISERTARNYHRKKYFRAYRMSGVRGVFLDADEVDAAMAKLTARQAKAAADAYGGAEVVEIARQVIISDDRLGGNR